MNLVDAKRIRNDKAMCNHINDILCDKKCEKCTLYHTEEEIKEAVRIINENIQDKKSKRIKNPIYVKGQGYYCPMCNRRITNSKTKPFYCAKCGTKFNDYESKQK